MFLLTSIIGFAVFLWVLVRTFQVRNHPYTVLAFAGAVTYAIATVEILQLIHLDWKSLIIIPLTIIVAWFSYTLFRQVGKKSPKEIILKSLIPLTFVIGYFAIYNIWFIFPMFFMALASVVLVPKNIKEERQRLFIS
jgi:hypothetical protein